MGNFSVTMSLVPGTVYSGVASECHLCYPSNLPTGKVFTGVYLLAAE